MTSGLVWLVDGARPTQVPAGYDVLAGSRSVWWTWRLLDLDERFVGTLEGVRSHGSSLEQNVYAAIRGTGSMYWRGWVEDEPDWLTVRVQPVYHAHLIDGSTVSWPMGVLLPAITRRRVGHGVAVVEAALYDKTVILAEGGPRGTYTVKAGTNVVAKVRQILAATVGGAVNIPDHAAALRSTMVWGADDTEDVTWLRIVNDLLDTINHWALWADGSGVLTSGLYVEPARRPLVWGFGPGEVSAEEVELVRDTFLAFNELTLVSRADGDQPALVSTRVNDDPDDPLSTVRRRWVISRRIGNVEAASQAALDAQCERMLAEASQVATTVTVEHGPLPLPMNSRVRVHRPRSGVDVPGVVRATRVDCTPTALWSSTIQEVRA